MSVGRRPARFDRSALLVGAAALTLGVSYTLPTVTFRTITSQEAEVYSIWGGIVSLWRDGNVVLAPIVFLFSIVFPVVKLVLLGWVIATPLHAVTRGRYELVEWLRRLGKWSMLDVLIIALFVGSIRIGLATASSLAGIHVFCAAIVLSILASVSLARSLRATDVASGASEASATMDTWSPARIWTQRVVSLACLVGVLAALSQTLLTVSKALFFSNEVGLWPMARALVSSGERGLGSVLLVGVVALPTLRALVGVVIGWRPTRSRRALVLARALDEWAMLDVLALALAIVHVKLEELATTRLLPGFWAVYVAGALSVLDAWLVRRRGARVGRTGEQRARE
jgi:paraquat-inducible protein A